MAAVIPPIARDPAPLTHPLGTHRVSAAPPWALAHSESGLHHRKGKAGGCCRAEQHAGDMRKVQTKLACHDIMMIALPSAPPETENTGARIRRRPASTPAK